MCRSNDAVQMNECIGKVREVLLSKAGNYKISLELLTK